MLVAMAIMGLAGSAAAQTNYPLSSVLELRDANGNLINETTPTCPEDGVTVYSTGWLANSAVHATFHSDPVDLGSHSVDSAGVLQFTFRVASVTNGVHTLILDGFGADGAPRTVQASILCQCKQPTTPVAVLGNTVSATGATSGTSAASGQGFFGKTGLDVSSLLAVAVDLILIGLVLRLAHTRQSRRGWLSTSLSERSLGSP